MFGKKILKKMDQALQGLGQFGFNACDLTGDIVLIPAKINRTNIKNVGAGAIICGSIATVGGVSASSNAFSGHYNVLTGEYSDKSQSARTTHYRAVPTASIHDSKPEQVNYHKAKISETLKEELSRDFFPLSRGLNESQLSELASIVNYEGSTSFREAILNLAPQSQIKFYDLFVEYHSLTGELVNLKSAWRSVAKQRSLYKSMPSNLVASECGSVHAIGAVDVDRKGMGSRQVAKMTKMGLLKKHRVYSPPEVGEAWHLEDPDVAYVRFWSKKNPERKIYQKYVCQNLTGPQHHEQRLKDNVFSVTDSFKRVTEVVAYKLQEKKIPAKYQQVLFDFMLLSVRAESVYGKRMLSHTAAKGWWMFTDATAKQYGLKYPMELESAADSTIDLAVDNIVGLIKAGIEVTPENIYYSHMIGLTGNKIRLKALSGQNLTIAEKAIFDRVISNNLPKDLFEKNYFKQGKLSVKRKGLSYVSVATDYTSFFEDRFKTYAGDNLFLSSVVFA